jgi:hypothetical protein
MRPDFSKVLVERPRGGLRGPRHAPRVDRAMIERDPDAIPAFESTSRHRGGTKHLSEHLGPLKRFLQSRAGRPWNDVYSELSEHVCRDNPIQAHALEHLYSYVTLRVEVRADGVYDATSGYALGLYGHRAFYVCPATGRLTSAPVRPRPRRASAPDATRRVVVDARTQFRRIDGVWYRVDFEALPRDPRSVVYDVVLRRGVTNAHPHLTVLRAEHDSDGCFAARKRQLDSRTIRRERLPVAG